MSATEISTPTQLLLRVLMLSSTLLVSIMEPDDRNRIIVSDCSISSRELMKKAGRRDRKMATSVVFVHTLIQLLAFILIRGPLYILRSKLECRQTNCLIFLSCFEVDKQKTKVETTETNSSLC